jgi:glycosyltransferase involved in cell wall biosynthesis/O-antigen/teichoic acid export membrane protein
VALAPVPAAKTGEVKLVAATGVVSVLNYCYTLALIWMLPASQYAIVGSASALLLICGTISGASIPWVLSREVASGHDDQQRRRAAVTFCLLVTAVQSLAAGLATCLIALHYADDVTVAIIFGSVAMIFTAATAVGYLQGLERFGLITALKITEVVVKVALGLGLVALGAGAGGALAGFAVGAAIVAAGSFVVMKPDLHWARGSLKDRGLWLDARGLLAIQAGAAVLASLDIVMASLLVAHRTSLATYQAAQILARVPVFVASSLSLVAFPRLVSQRAHTAISTRDILVLYAQICIPITMVTVTLPSLVTHHLFPSSYGDVALILPVAALGGFFMGTINLVTTFFQASRAFLRTAVLLVAGIVLQAALVGTGLAIDGIFGLTVAVAIGAATTASALMVRAHLAWPGCSAGVARAGLASVLLATPLVVLRGRPVFWFAWAVVGVGLPALRSLLRFSEKTARNEGGTGRPRVLHLAYEDPRAPGAGGGSVRTHEINSRLSDDFEINVVCARYPGAKERVEDGVRYVHVGLGPGNIVSRVSYFFCLPFALWRWGSELVVEDFGAPFSSVAVPWMTSRPTVGVVQWLFAREKAAQYHLPFGLVERVGLSSHRDLVAVSEDLATELRARNPAANVAVVPNGLPEDAFVPRSLPRRDIGFLGRLEIAQKGLDLLLSGYAGVAGEIDQDLVLGGDGPDRGRLEQLARDLGVADRVHFVGRIATDSRLDWLASFDLVAMPSRYETFGMVAAEALAVGTPVVAFDIPCLRAIVTPSTGVLVPSIDAAALGRALAALSREPQRRAQLGAAGPATVSWMRWDTLAAAQSKFYRQVLEKRILIEERLVVEDRQVVEQRPTSGLEARQ